MRARGVIRHVIFDLDGTLVDSCAICVDILSDMLDERHSDHVIDPVKARGQMSRGGATMIAALLGPACVDPVADLAEFRARYLDRHTPPGSVFPGVASGLHRMRESGLRLSICSNKPQYLCDKVLDDTGLADHFAVVVGARPGARPKPAPDLLDAVLAELGADASECRFVGDSELDHDIARDAGMAFHFLSYGYAADDWLPALGTTFHSFASLTDAIVSHHVDA